MVYLEPHQMGWHPLMLSWMETLPTAIHNQSKFHLKGLFEWLVPPSIKFVRRNIREISQTSDANLVMGLMRLFYSLIDEFKNDLGFFSVDLMSGHILSMDDSDVG